MVSIWTGGCAIATAAKAAVRSREPGVQAGARGAFGRRARAEATAAAARLWEVSRLSQRLVELWRHMLAVVAFLTGIPFIFPLPAAASARPLPVPLGGAGAGRGRLNGTLPHWGCLGHAVAIAIHYLRSQKGTEVSCQRTPRPRRCPPRPRCTCLPPWAPRAPGATGSTDLCPTGGDATSSSSSSSGSSRHAVHRRPSGGCEVLGRRGGCAGCNGGCGGGSALPGRSRGAGGL